MPIQISWDTPTQDQILIELSPPLTWNDFQNSVHEAHQMIARVDHAVDMIIWAKLSLPQGFALPQFRAAFQNQPKNIRQVIIVPEDKPKMMMFFKRLASVIQQAFPKKGSLIFVDSIEEARSLNSGAKSI